MVELAAHAHTAWDGMGCSDLGSEVGASRARMLVHNAAMYIINGVPGPPSTLRPGNTCVCLPTWPHS
jgi:hypothetical protein